MLAVVGRPLRSMLMSEPDTASACVAVLLPPEPLPPVVSLVAPVEAVRVALPGAVGVPLTGHEMLAPAATVAGRVGVQVPTVTPAGLAHMEDSARAAIAMLADIRPDVVLFACTSGSFFQGADHERELAADLESIAGAPVVTTST